MDDAPKQTPMSDHVARFISQLKDGWHVGMKGPNGAHSHYGGKDFNAALVAVLAEPAAIKPLQWFEPTSRTNGCWTATCIFGTFSVAFDDGWHASLEDGLLWEWEPEQDPRSYDGPHEAKHACLQFYENRIRSALVDR